MVRELVVAQNYEQIERICKILSEHFVLSQNGNFRRGGLIGIAALAIACGKVNFVEYYFHENFYLKIRKHKDLNNILYHQFYNVFLIMIQKFDIMHVNHCII
jgi:uncharacterized membrane protein